MSTVILIICLVLVVIAFMSRFNNKRVLRAFADGNVIVFGLRGRGKDLLFSFVTNAQSKQKIVESKKSKKPFRKAVTRDRQYISNVNYTSGVGYLPFTAESMNLGGNDFHNFINGNITYYDYPYLDNTDYFISDAGVYFPSQYNGELDKKYKSLPVFSALSRHVGKCNVHTNTQSLSRLWIKLREQSDTYIHCKKCNVKPLFKNYYFVTQKVTIYDNLTSAEQKRPPFPMTLSYGKEVRMRRAEYKAKYGSIQNLTLRYVTKLTYDDRVFKTMLLGGVKSVN